MQLHLTLRHLPTNRELKDSCSLPFACLVQPFAATSGRGNDDCVSTDDIARCGKCYGYINRYCKFEPTSWECVLCRHKNEILPSSRYAQAGHRETLTELTNDFVEARCMLNGRPTKDQEEAPQTSRVGVEPICLALVDVSCSEESMDLTQSSLRAALEGLPPSARFGIVTFSTKIGLWDVTGGAPSVKYLHIIEHGTESPTSVELQHAVPLDNLAPTVESHKHSFAAAIDLLRPEELPLPKGIVDPFDDSPGDSSTGTRGFGSALQAVLRMLGSCQRQAVQLAHRQDRNGLESSKTRSNEHLLAGAKILSFLSGPANHGRGAVERWLPSVDLSVATPNGYHANGSPGPSADTPSTPFQAVQPQQKALPEARAFYEEAGMAAASLGVAVDLLLASDSYCGADLMLPLVECSGGCLYSYSHIETAPMPQDVYRHLVTPQARNGLLRVRTSSEFKVVKGYRLLTADPTYDNLYYTSRSDPTTTYAFDFDYSQQKGLSADRELRPYVQIAYQYNQIVRSRVTEASSSLDAEYQPQGGNVGQLRCVLERRLRIQTLPMRVAEDQDAVYQSADPEAILAVLMHKIGRTAELEGVEEARTLLQDWLVLACSAYSSRPSSKSKAGHVDIRFNDAPQLQMLPQLIYGLLKSPLLDLTRHTHADSHPTMCHAWKQLPPDLLAKAIYPCLIAYADPETPVLPPLGLSRASLIAAQKPIFFLDSLTALTVYYSADAAKIPFPPPKGSALRRTLDSIRQSRRPSTALKLLVGGKDDVRPFLALLLEDPKVDEIGKVITPSFADFVEKIRMQVWQHLEARKLRD